MFFILSAIFLWSSLGIVIRLSGEPVHVLIFFSCAISSSLIGPMLLRERYRRVIPGGRILLFLLIIGPISLVNSFSFFYAYQNTTVANAVLTHYTAPILVAFLAPVFLKERLTARIGAAVVLATVGLWIMLGVSFDQFLRLVAAGDRSTGGILAGLLSGFAYAVLIILLRFFAQSIHPLVLTFFQNLVIGAMLLPFVDFHRDFSSSLWAFGVMGVVHSTIAPVLYLRGMSMVSANRAAILGYLEPVSAILIGAVFLGEIVNEKTLFGGGLILLSGFLTLRNARTSAPSARSSGGRRRSSS